MRSQVARLRPTQAVRDAVQNCGGIHVACTRRVDRLNGNTLNRNDFVAMHQDRSGLTERQRDVFGVLVNDLRALDRVFFASQRASFVDVAKQQIDIFFDELPESIAEKADQKRVRDGERNFHMILLGEFHRFQSGCSRPFASEKVTFHINILGLPNIFFIDVVRTERR